MKELFSWLVTSSADPARLGLMVRGLLVGIVPAISFMMPLACSLIHVCVDLSAISPAIDAIVQIVVALATVISGGMILLGLIRKAVLGQWSASQ